MGNACNIFEDPDLLEQSLEANGNSDTIVDFGKMSKKEVELLLDPQKFEEWMLFLHPDQKSIVEATYPDRPVILREFQEVVRLLFLYTEHWLVNTKVKNIGIITLNRDLAKLIENLLAKLCVDGEEKFIKVQAYYDYFKEVIDFFGPEKYLDEMINQTPEENSGF